jgi:hypothetical protein
VWMLSSERSFRAHSCSPRTIRTTLSYTHPATAPAHVTPVGDMSPRKRHAAQGLPPTTPDNHKSAGEEHEAQRLRVSQLRKLPPPAAENWHDIRCSPHHKLTDKT